MIMWKRDAHSQMASDPATTMHTLIWEAAHRIEAARWREAKTIRYRMTLSCLIQGLFLLHLQSLPRARIMFKWCPKGCPRSNHILRLDPGRPPFGHDFIPHWGLNRVQMVPKECTRSNHILRRHPGHSLGTMSTRFDSTSVAESCSNSAQSCCPPPAMPTPLTRQLPHTSNACCYVFSTQSKTVSQLSCF